MRIVAISDAHANAPALRRALELTLRAAPDHVIILGDLLTYGLDVEETQDLVELAVEQQGAEVILGNHDQLYLDLSKGLSEYFSTLPEWIRESVEYTMERLNVASFRSRYVWKTELKVGPALASHANPFGYGDWTYLNTEEDLVRAGETLRERGASAGIFGHNHRGCVLVANADGAGMVMTMGTSEGRWTDGTTLVANPGSVGQPRNKGGGSTMLTLDLERKGFRASIHEVDYDVEAHVAAIGASTLSLKTRERLTAFFR